MRRAPRCAALVVRFAGLAGALAGCAPDPVEIVETFCRDRMDGARSCTSDCYDAVDGALGACFEHGRTLFALPEHAEFARCAMLCAPGLACPERPSLTDCACTSACLRDRSTEYQDAWATYVQCVDVRIASECY